MEQRKRQQGEMDADALAALNESMEWNKKTIDGESSKIESNGSLSACSGLAVAHTGHPVGAPRIPHFGQAKRSGRLRDYQTFFHASQPTATVERQATTTVIIERHDMEIRRGGV
jgi:hypothetical protein